MRLVEASLDEPDGLVAFVEELAASGAGLGDANFASRRLSLREYLEALVDVSRGEGLPAGWIAATTFWLLDDADRVVGMSNLRHSLTPSLLKRGGHISYYVKANERGKGYGTAALALTLRRARERGINRVLLTVASHNLASVKVIERNGGELEDEGYDEEAGETYRRYWIALSAGKTVFEPP